MASFNIKEDLQFRPDDQKLEIVCISGPSARDNMRMLIEKNFKSLEKRYGLKVDPKVAERIVSQYGKHIMAPPPWER